MEKKITLNFLWISKVKKRIIKLIRKVNSAILVLIINKKQNAIINNKKNKPVFLENLYALASVINAYKK